MIGLITYDYPHKKTQDILFRLRLTGERVHLFILPWHERPNHVPLFPHRPDNSRAVYVTPSQMATRMGCGYSRVADGGWALAGLCDCLLIGGAGMLPPEVVSAHRVINAHPGYLPLVRGLDALKWALYDGLPVGVTTHEVSAECDAGEMIERQVLRPEITEDYGAFCRRVYEREVEMLVGAIGKEAVETLDVRGTPRRRMKHRDELAMMERYERRRRA